MKNWSEIGNYFNTNSLYLFHDGGPYHVETSPLIYSANQWTGFYKIGTFVIKELKTKSEEVVQRCYVKQVFAKFIEKLHLRSLCQYSCRLTACSFINPFVPNAPFLYPLKTSENLTVF